MGNKESKATKSTIKTWKWDPASNKDYRLRVSHDLMNVTMTQLQ